MGDTAHSFVSSVLIGALLALAAQPALACTRVLWNDNKLAVVTGRSMDWPESTEPKLVVFPRGLERHGGKVGPAVVVADNAAMWTSKYGSMVVTVYDIGAVDGFNERGLGAHLLFLTATDFGPRDASKPGIAVNLWAQYLLDNAATVTEALALLDDVQIVMAEARGRKGTVHLALEDASGDSAIIEYVAGKRV
ncbi:MAG: linear amide C-N hydrolase, partial [Delftia acidovorans]|nr:linear amide C-N hydrolase [Delftia acidovorans]